MLTLKDLQQNGWESGINQVVMADCLEAMKLIPDKSIDLILTDPPYGISMADGFDGFDGFGGRPGGKPILRRRYKGEWDESIPSDEVFKEMFRISKNQMIFGGNFFTHILPQGNHWLVWDKLNTMPTFSDCELIWTSFPRNSVKKYTHNNNGLMATEKHRVHPTQKPCDLVKRLIESYTEGGIICDPFMGSWTTARACKDLGRNFIGFELEEDYCKIGEERLRQGNLF